MNQYPWKSSISIAFQWVFSIAFSILLVSCQGIKQSGQVNLNKAQTTYSLAIKMIKDLHYDSAVFLLEKAYIEGLTHPMRIVTDPKMYPLVDLPEYRSRIRSLLKFHAKEDHAVMVRKEELGDPIHINGQVLDARNKGPVPDVNVELVHTDNKGKYFEEKSIWNPRLFAYLKTNNNGEFSIRTIRPKGYVDDHGKKVPSHVHFTLEKDEYRTYASEFTFADDPVFLSTGNLDNVPVATRIDADSIPQYKVTILLQRK